MKRIFVDTNHFIALLYSRDQWHEKAVKAETANGHRPLVTTEEVLIELLNFFCEHGRFARIKVTAFVHAVLVDVRTEVIFRSETNFLEALDLYVSRPDKGYSLTDCISMNVCKSLGVDEILTNDDHFGRKDLQFFYEICVPEFSFITLRKGY